MTPLTIPCPIRGYRREVPNWERRDMTVCIAAVCEENLDDPKIIVCTDRKVSGELGSAEIVLKQRTVTHRWSCLTAGIDSEILCALQLLKKHFDGAKEIDETNVLAITRAALNQRKRDKAEEIVQGKYGISYVDFVSTGKARFPDDAFRSAMTEVEIMELGAEFIIFGYINTFPILIRTNQRCMAVIKEDFAVIGEGGYLAQAALLNRGHSSVEPFGKSLYCAYEAKKYAEGAPTVGRTTSVMVHHRNGSYESINSEGRDFLEKKYKEFGPRTIPRAVPVAADCFDQMRKQ
jgi:hypothetical protein